MIQKASRAPKRLVFLRGIIQGDACSSDLPGRGNRPAHPAWVKDSIQSVAAEHEVNPEGIEVIDHAKTNASERYDRTSERRHRRGVTRAEAGITHRRNYFGAMMVALGEEWVCQWNDPELSRHRSTCSRSHWPSRRGQENRGRTS